MFGVKSMRDIFTTFRKPSKSIPKPVDPAFVKVTSVQVNAEIQYRYAVTDVTCTVVNTSIKSGEIFSVFIIPETAFISEFKMEVDGNIYKSHVKEKEKSDTLPEEEQTESKIPRYLEYVVRDSNRLTVSLNVDAGKDVVFRLKYEELLKRELGSYNYRVNINYGRVVPDMKIEVRILETSSLSFLKTFPNGGSQEKSERSEHPDGEHVVLEYLAPYKAIVCLQLTEEQQEKLVQSESKGQLVISYDMDRKTKPEEILISNGYFVHFFAPKNIPVMMKHMTFVLDVSGSMNGLKLQRLIEAMTTILSDMSSDDFFTLIIFSTFVLVWDPDGSDEIPQEWITAKNVPVDAPCTQGPLPLSTIVQATEDNIERAKKFIKSLKAYSITDIHGALFKALEAAYLGKTLTSLCECRTPPPEPIIFFLTDGKPNGKVNDLDRIVIEVTSGNTDIGASIFSLGFGEEADMGFLKKLSLCNSGFARKIYEASDAATHLTNVYLQIALPLLSKVRFKYEDDKVDIATVTKTSFPVYFSESEIVISGRVHRCSITGSVATRTRVGSYSHTFICPQLLPDYATCMERTWAFLTLQQLLDSITAKGKSKSEACIAKAVQLALKYSFVTPLTSLVVVKPDDETTAIIERGDEIQKQLMNRSNRHRCRNMKKKKGGKSTQGVPFDLLAAPPTSRYRRLYKKAQRDMNARTAQRRATRSHLLERLARMTLSPQRNTSDSKDVGPELHITSRVTYQEAFTELTITIPDSSLSMLQGDVKIQLPDEAVVTSCTFEVAGKELNGTLKSKDEAKLKFDSYTGNAALFHRPANQRDLLISFRLIRDENLTFKIKYQQFVRWTTGMNYEYIIPTDVNDIIKKVSINVRIDECYNITDVKSFLKGDHQDLLVGSVKEIATNRATISWSADETKIQDLKKMNIFGKFLVCYGMDKSNCPDTIITTPGGYAIHRCHKNILVPDVRLILVIKPELKDEAVKFLESVAINKVTIVVSPRDIMVLEAENEESLEAAKKFLSGIVTAEGNILQAALLKAIKIARKWSHHSKSVIVVLTTGYINPVLVGVVTTANLITETPIFGLTFHEDAGLKYLKDLAFRNFGVTRVLYKSCDTTFQIMNFTEDLRSHIAEPATFRFIEDQPYLDKHWLKLCLQKTVQMSEFPDQAPAKVMQSSFVSAVTSIIATKTRNA